MKKSLKLMMGLLTVLVLISSACCLPLNDRVRLLDTADHGEECVVLLHGLGRTYRSMKVMQSALAQVGFRTLNIDYPSTRLSVSELVDTVLQPKIAQYCSPDRYQLSFVGHSMGGIISRDYIDRYRPPKLGKLVMLAPPNQGSELIDTLGVLFFTPWILGPAAMQLGTGADSVPNNLPKPDYQVLIVAGTQSTNPLYSWLIPGVDDGKVSVDRTQIEGVTKFITVPYGHTAIMKKSVVVEQVLVFLLGRSTL